MAVNVSVAGLGTKTSVVQEAQNINERNNSVDNLVGRGLPALTPEEIAFQDGFVKLVASVLPDVRLEVNASAHFEFVRRPDPSVVDQGEGAEA